MHFLFFLATRVQRSGPRTEHGVEELAVACYALRDGVIGGRLHRGGGDLHAYPPDRGLVSLCGGAPASAARLSLSRTAAD